MRILAFVLFLALIELCDNLRVLQVLPAVADSHVIFNSRLANSLTAHGHNVTLINVAFLPEIKSTKELAVDATEIRHSVNISEADLNSTFRWLQEEIFRKNLGFSDLIRFSSVARQIWPSACRELLDVIETQEHPALRPGSFDVAIGHYFDLCPIAMAHTLHIPKFLWVTPGTYILEYAAITMGIPIVPSFIPGAMFSASDNMGFFQRTKNCLYSGLVYLFTVLPAGNTLTDETEMFQEFPNSDRPSLFSLAEQTSLLLLNGEIALDFPRPLPSNVIFLGELGASEPTETFRVEGGFAEPFQTWIHEAQNLIIFSLGTVARPDKMPIEMKATFVQGLANFTDYSIIWRMEGEIPGIENHPHIHVSSWLPQKQLLQHPKTRLFITHGGYNSLLESTKAGVPMVMIPLFADQNSNAARADRHALGRVLPDKLAITPRSFQDAVNAVLTQPQYEWNAKRLSVLLGDKLISPEEEFARRLETVVRAPWYPKLGAAQRLSLWQYHSLDVLALLLLLFFVAVCVLVKLLLVLLRIVETARKKKRR